MKRPPRTVPGRLLILLMTALLPSCVGSKNPLSDPEKSKPDERLFGVWNCVKVAGKEVRGKHYWLLCIGKAEYSQAPPGLMTAISVGNDEDNRVTVKRFSDFFPTSLGRENYANWIDTGSPPDLPPADPLARRKWDGSKVRGYLFVKYAVEGDQLTIWLTDESAAERAISRGQVKGTVERKGMLRWKHMTLTGTSRELARFLLDGGDGLLFLSDSHKVVFKRVK